MQKLTASALSLMVAFSALASSTPASAHRNRGLAIGAGVALGVAAAAIIANSHRAHADEYYSSSGDRYDRCDRWRWRCDHGNDYACEKFERYCE